MKYTIEVENIKCGGCANTIKKKVSENHPIDEIEVEVESGAITIHSAKDQQTAIEETLQSLGYPKKGSVEGLNNVKAKAVSFVSCAIGRMDQP